MKSSADPFHLFRAALSSFVINYKRSKYKIKTPSGGRVSCKIAAESGQCHRVNAPANSDAYAISEGEKGKEKSKEVPILGVLEICPRIIDLIHNRTKTS